MYKKNNTVTRASLIAFSLCALATECASGSVITIDEAVVKALDTGITMRIADASVTAKQEELLAAQKTGAPSLNADLSAVRGGGEPTSFFAVNNTSTPDEPLGSAQGNYGVANLVLNIPIYENGTFFNHNSPAIQLADGNYQKAQSDKQGQTVEVSNQVAKAYLNALSAAEESELQEAVYKKLEKLLEYVQDRKQTRVATRADELAVESALAEKKVDVNSARRRHDLQLLQLGALLEIEHSDRPAIAKLQGTPPALPSIENLLEKALMSQPAIKSQDAAVKIARADLSSTRNAESTTLSFIAMGTAASGLHSGTQTPMFGSAGLKLSIPLLPNGQKNAQIRAKNLAVLEQEERLKFTSDSVIQEVYTAYYASQDALDELEASQKVLAQAQHQGQLSASKLEKGLINVDTLIQDEADTLAAQVEMTKKHYGAWSAYADVLKAIGLPFSSKQNIGLQ